jgi:protein SCO1
MSVRRRFLTWLQALKLMRPEDAAKVQVLFATVDPQRDTPEILQAYVPYFHPDFLGLHGNPEQVAQAANEFKIVYRKQVEAGASDYLIDHSAGIYVLDRRAGCGCICRLRQRPPISRTICKCC